ncbi:hypothetical protein QE250_02070 [Chromatiaceae bacterium AAb-1]|nr:hypothetical protein [Chromatiaceae bacterium AAb-1]
MATDIITAQGKPALNTVALACKRVLYMVCLLPSVAVVAAEIKFVPQITVSGYGYQLKEEPATDWDEGLAASVAPAVSWIANGNNLKSSLFWQTESIWYDDAQREHDTFDEYRFNNVVSGFNKRLHWGLNASSNYRVRNSQQGVFADRITGAQHLGRIRSHGSFLNWNTLPISRINGAVNLNYRKNKSEEPQEQDGFSNFENETYNAALQLASKDRAAGFFWQLGGNYTKTTRETADDFVSKHGNFLVGVPLYHRLSLIGRGSYESNDSSEFYNNEFRSYGAGLEFKFGRVSRVNVSVNRAKTENQFGEEEETYLAGDFYLAPSRRSSLSGYWDRRYFGRTAAVSGQYNLRFLTMRLSVNDTVRSMSALDFEFEDLGVFVCPDGYIGMSDCFRPPSAGYQPGAGETFQRFFDINQDIREDIVLRRSGALSIGYNKNRLALNLGLSVSEDEFVELGSVNRSNTASLNVVWKLSEHLRWVSNIRFYELNYVTEQREDNNLSASTGLEKTLSAHSDISFNVRRTSRNSNVVARDISENRVWFSYRYKF